MTMKPIEQLRSILCTVESVEKDVKEIKIGTFVEYKIYRNTHLGILQKLIFKNNCFYGGDIRHISDMNGEMLLDYNNSSTIKIIGNPLSLKHIMMYANEKGIKITIERQNMLFEILGDGSYIKYNYNLELHEQEDKVLLDIINFFKGQLGNQ